MKKKNENIKKKKIKSPPFTSVKKELLNALLIEIKSYERSKNKKKKKTYKNNK